MAISHRSLTLDQFLGLPEEEPALEYFEGVVTQKVSPKGRHGALQGALARRFDNFAEPRRLARAFPETRTTFGGASYVPDIVVYRWDRIPREPDGTVADDFQAAPDIAVEILSPGQAVRALADRCRWYVANGVQIALLVNPRDRTVTAFRPNAPERVLRGADRIDVGDVVPGFTFAVDDLFAALRAD